MPTPDIAWAYPLLLKTHLGLVVTSVGLFSVRALAALQGQGWPLRKAWRRASEGVDTALLTAGAGLWWLLQLNPLHTPWFGLKLGLLLVYIALGMLTMRSAASTPVRALGLLAAWLCVAFMASIALARHPLGWWAP
ncbi:SirB2 family protein [Hydrogenophaga sp.]|uniref:SirB2 family protein n=1 Tax=Hydrogenophaga sp. TaxID=1904254 RepID=UPI002720375D|nr:SirB2 family protein [Hydrogenophaga sp.]MDO9134699.1 SirB2 family protein [Hydrogenophaga sp.]MDP3350012.1 SirB2 family protein [Hydrogenophaga sp.]